MKQTHTCCDSYDNLCAWLPHIVSIVSLFHNMLFNHIYIYFMFTHIPCMYIYIYIPCMYIYICICIYLHVYIYMYNHIYIYVYMYMYIIIYIHVFDIIFPNISRKSAHVRATRLQGTSDWSPTGWGQRLRPKIGKVRRNKDEGYLGIIWTYKEKYKNNIRITKGL